ncbi:MAG: NAD(P)H-quinone oxidoreductase subunit 4, partial [Halothece sp.]
MPWLSAMILFPLLGASIIPFFPRKTLRWYAFSVSLINFLLTLYAFGQNFNLNNSQFQLQESYPWLPEIGLNWSLAVDGLSMPLIVLSGLITTLAIFAAWNVTEKP